MVNIEKTNIFNIEKFNNEINNFKIQCVSNRISINNNKNQNKDKVFNKYIEWVKLNWSKYMDKESIEKHINSGTIILASYLYPSYNEELFFEALKSVDYFFLIDDLFIEEGNFSIERVKRFGDPTIEQDHLTEIYWEFMNNFKKYSHKDNVDKLMKASHEHVLNELLSSSTGIYHSHMSLDEFYQIRSIEVGGDLCFTCGLMDSKEAILDEIYYSNELKFVSKNFKTLTFLINDLFSFKKESKLKYFNNIVKVLSYQENSIQKGVDKCNDLICEYYIKFIESIENVKKVYPNNKPLEDICNGAINFTCGNYFGSRSIKRYSQN